MKIRVSFIIPILSIGLRAIPIHAAIEPPCNPTTPKQLLFQAQNRINNAQAAYNIAYERMKNITTTLRCLDPLELSANIEIATSIATKLSEAALTKATRELQQAKARKQQAKTILEQLLSFAMAAHPRLGKKSPAQQLFMQDGQQQLQLAIFNYLLAPSNLPTKTCFHCLKTGIQFKRCSRCKIAYYCTPECQQKDWPNHAPECKP